MYQPPGLPSFGGLATCIWLGYDPQNPVATFRGIGARILGTKADVHSHSAQFVHFCCHCTVIRKEACLTEKVVGKTGIMVTEGVSDVLIEGYELHHINARGPTPDGSGQLFHPCDTCCGIALNRMADSVSLFLSLSRALSLSLSLSLSLALSASLSLSASLPASA